jgi:hypothetical protein
LTVSWLANLVSSSRYHDAESVIVAVSRALLARPSIDVGAIEAEKLTDELIVQMGELKVAIRLPEELQSAERLKLDFSNGAFVLVDP